MLVLNVTQKKDWELEMGIYLGPTHCLHQKTPGDQVNARTRERAFAYTL